LSHTFGASITVPDRFQAWRAAGVFKRFWQAGLTEYAAEVGIDWEWNALDGAIVKAPLGEKATRANPSDRGKCGTKRSLLADGNGIHLAIVLAGANRHDMKLVEHTWKAQSMVPTDLSLFYHSGSKKTEAKSENAHTVYPLSLIS
jgi:transposase